jgi:hypothetical protein
MNKIDYAVGAARLFIHHLHQDGIDRGMVATFGNTFRVEQRFTTTEAYLHNALAQIPQSLGNAIRKQQGERTRLYDSIEDVISEFWRTGGRNRPWLLTIITDGQDNESYRYKDNPLGVGRHIAQKFNHEPSNFPFLIGVGEDRQIDKYALGIIGNYGGFPAVTIAAFPLLELIFLNIAVKVSTELLGLQIQTQGLTWQQVSEIRRMSRVPIDYAFLIDRSGSMSESGN